MSCIIFGATGLVGKEILHQAEQSLTYTKIYTVTRRAFDTKSDKVEQHVETDIHKYSEFLGQLKPKTVYSALATTRAIAGLAEAFYDIDYTANIEIAKAARAAGAETFVLVSSIGALAQSRFLYMQTKGKLEDDIIALKFPHTVILRPGPLLGLRERKQSTLNWASASFSKLLHGTYIGNNFVHPFYGPEVAQVAVGKAAEPVALTEPKVEILGGKEMREFLKTAK